MARRARARLAALREVSRRRNAWDRMIDGLRSQYHGLEDVEGRTIQFRLHSSHQAIECGGSVGCISCGLLVSRQRKNQRMERPCVPHPGPKVSGSFHRVGKVAQGLHPYSRDAPWPKGGAHPAPRRVSFV